MDLSTVTVAMFKSRFPRGFNYYPTPAPTDSQYNYILDTDIQEALDTAADTLNQGLFPSDTAITRGMLLLSAHFLVLAIRSDLKGIQDTGQQLVVSKGVGSVNEAYAIPERFANDPILSSYNKTGYGQQYLALIMPYLLGMVGVVEGATNP